MTAVEDPWQDQLWLRQLLCQLGWLRGRVAIQRAEPFEQATHACLLSRLASLPEISAAGKNRLAKLIGLGWTLRRDFGVSALCHQPLHTLFLGHARYFSPARKYGCIAVSRLGRSNSMLPDWACWLDDVMRISTREDLQLFLVERTAAHRAFAAALKASGIETLTVRCDESKAGKPEHDTPLLDWCSKHLSRLSNHISNDDNIPKDTVWASPPATKWVVGQQHRDVLSLLLADQVFAPYVRFPGNISKLIDQRLDSLPAARTQTLVALSNTSCRADLPMDSLIERGAMLWTKRSIASRADGPSSTQSPSVPIRVGSVNHCLRRPPHTQQFIAPLDSVGGLENLESPFLLHCTRASTKLHPLESEIPRMLREWASMKEASSAFSTLSRILESGRLVASARWNRTQLAMVSFSAVPPQELLARRTFRSHLSRWDWEPYGLVIRKSALEKLGARPVIYGSEEDFIQLSTVDQPYFQLARSTSAKTGKVTDWTDEKEWRLKGNFVFSTMARSNVSLMVDRKDEALTMSRIHPWSVFWYRRRSGSHR